MFHSVDKSFIQFFEPKTLGPAVHAGRVDIYKIIAAARPNRNSGILKWINVGTHVSQI